MERDELTRLRKQNAEQARTIEVLRKPRSSSRRRATVSETYAFIEAEKTTHPGRFPVRAGC